MNELINTKEKSAKIPENMILNIKGYQQLSYWLSIQNYS